MAPTVNKAPKIKIVNPKNNAGNDLSDHYPIKMNINNLTVVSYNLQLMHLQVSSATAKGKETQSEIAQAVHDFVNFFVKQQADVCCVQELFDGEANKLMEDKMDKAGYFALARVGSTPYEVFNGGVRTFVKKSYLASPSRGLLSSYEHIYSEKIDYFVGADALANKGVSHSVITTEQKSVHIFNTHLQASYEGRRHYEEVTLAQCVELKRFIERQRAQYIITPEDTIMICGDFNIRMTQLLEARSKFGYEKMRRLMGPAFSFMDYDTSDPSAPQYTFSANNTNNQGMSQQAVGGLDFGIVYEPHDLADPLSIIDAELSDVYCDIQCSIAHFVKQNATLFSFWLLSTKASKQLNEFNQQFAQLMMRADEIKSTGANPLDDKVWFSHAVHLSAGPLMSKTALSTKQNEPDDKELRASETVPIEPVQRKNKSISNIDQCKQNYDRLMFELSELHSYIHKKYVDSPKYATLFSASLQLNHAMKNAGINFFRHPTDESLKTFKAICNKQLKDAEIIFKDNSSILRRISNFFKGVFSLILVIPAVMTSRNSALGFKSTFFKDPADSAKATLHNVQQALMYINDDKEIDDELPIDISKRSG